MGLGVVLVILGIITLSDAFLATLASMLVIGWLLVIGGAVQIAHGFRTRGWKAVLLHVLAGILYVVAGFMVVANPVAGALVLTLVAAFFLFTLGLLRLTMGALLRPPGWGWTIAAGVVDILLAVLISVHWPATAFWVIGLFVGIEMIVGGWSVILTSLELRRRELPGALDGRLRHMPPAA
ncbi:MAG: HdeD family acid-resistance protein [Streptosporangiaceae bacterium]